MSSKIEDLDKQVTELNEKLAKYVENGSEWNKIYNQSVLIDQVIVKYLNEKKRLNTIEKKLIKKNSDKLQLPDKEEIINEIKNDVKNKFPDVTEKDLEFFSTNLYIYATLTVLKAEKQDIINQLMFVNNRYIETHIIDRKKDIAVENNVANFENDDSITKIDYKYIRSLNDKYTKIIEEKLNA